MAKTDGVAPPDKLAKLASPARVAAFKTGLSAETRAAAYLMAKGYRILAKRFRTPYGEIDIVARRRNLLAFIEVKARANLDDAAYAVTARQQQRKGRIAADVDTRDGVHLDGDIQFHMGGPRVDGISRCWRRMPLTDGAANAAAQSAWRQISAQIRRVRDAPSARPARHQ